MSDDPIVRLAKLRLISDSADIEAQLNNTQGCRPILSVLVKARNEAAGALAGLAFIDAGKPEDVRDLQNIVIRYDDLIKWFKSIIDDGLEYDREITAEDREEMIDLLSQTLEGQREAEELGLVSPPGTHDA